MGEWRLLPGTTYENACEFAAIWIKDDGKVAEQLFLPGYIVKNLGHIPSPYIAWVLLRMRDQALG